MTHVPRRAVSSRLVLITGFGGLLILLLLAGFDGVRALRQIQADNDQIREDYVRRTRELERIRAGVYISGTYVRDYLLEPDIAKAESRRDELEQTRADVDSELASYRSRMNAAEAGALQALAASLDSYWKLLEPVLQWSAAQRKQAGYAFLRDEVFPRRTAMLGIADQIGSIAEAQLQAGRTGIEQRFAQSERRLILTVLLTIGLGVLLAAFSVRRILRLEADSAQRYEEIVQAREELKQLSARLVDAQENERRSISRELHDQVGQALTGVLVEMANLTRLIRTREMDAAGKSALEEKSGEIKRLLEESIGVVRNMSLLLRPSILDDLGLIPALQWQAREVSKRNGIAVKVAAESVSEALPEEVATCVFRVTQEALHNCVQHAGAHNVRVTIRQELSRLLLSVQDDGKGFRSPEKERGMGLLGMEERVGHLGGTFSVESEMGRGTVLRVALPLAIRNTAVPGAA